MKSVMSHQFSQIPNVNIPRSVFDRSHGYKTTFDADYLIPIMVDEVLPGDTVKLDLSHFARLATPIAPFMDNMFLDTFHFFVPARLVWDNWQRFNGETSGPSDPTGFPRSVDDYSIPTLQALTTFTEGSLGDYFGLPTGVALSEINSLPFRCYNLIWNEWFRDQNLQDEITVDTDDGPDAIADYVLKKRNKKHDYFTSCLPWPQKGDSPTIGVGTSAPVVGDGYAMGLIAQDAATNLREFGMSNGGAGTYLDGNTGAIGVLAGNNYTPATAMRIGQAIGLHTDGTKTHVYADLSAAGAVTINELRQSFQIQRMIEKDARGGTRYIEIIKAHFGVTSPDYRLQRPEYLGGSSDRININPIAQTSSTDATTPQGNLAAFGVSGARDRGFNKSFVEHGYIISLVNVRADLTYQQGINKMWSRETRYDFYWPSFAHLGEQAVLSKEIYADGTANDEDVFGYQERYAEYRYKPSLITGVFRSSATTPLDMWHLSQVFGSRPTLNSTFITSDTPVDRVIAVNTEPHFLFDAYINMKCARPMPVYSVPGLIDHF